MWYFSICCQSKCHVFKYISLQITPPYFSQVVVNVEELTKTLRHQPPKGTFHGLEGSQFSTAVTLNESRVSGFPSVGGKSQHIFYRLET